MQRSGRGGSCEMCLDLLGMTIIKLALLLLWAHSFHLLKTEDIFPSDGKTFKTNKARNCTVNNTSNENVLECRDLGLSNLPTCDNMSAIVVGYDFRGNRLKELANNSFQCYPNLKRLDLSGNYLRNLSVLAFAHLSKLSTLDLRNNRLTYDTQAYPTDVFTPLVNLKKLYLANIFSVNRGSIKEYLFEGLVKLKHLYIDNWPISQQRFVFGELKSLQNLEIVGENCNLERISNDTFKNIQLKRLHLHCDTSHVDQAAFAYFKYIDSIIFHTSRFKGIPLGEVMKTFQYFKGRNMSEIDLSGVQNANSELKKIDSKITMSILNPLREICLKKLDLSNNKIKILDRSIRESVYDIPLWNCLEEFNLSRNRIIGNMLFFRNLSFLPNLKVINIYNNAHDIYPELSSLSTLETNINGFSVYLPPQLENLSLQNSGSLDLKYNNFDIHFYNGSNFRRLDISKCGRIDVGLRKNITGLSSLKFLDISESTIYPSLFENTDIKTSLVTLNASDSVMKFDIMESKAFFDMPKIRILDLSGIGLPAVKSNTISRFQNLEKLYISKNKLDYMPLDVLSLPLLEHLDLSHNHFRVLGVSERVILDDKVTTGKNFTLRLTGNVLSCSCVTLDFIHWLQETHVTLDNKGNYSCVTINGSMTDTHSFYSTAIWRKCTGPILLTITLMSFLVLIMTLMIAFLIKKYFPKLEWFIFNTLGYNLYRPPKRLDFTHDAYICYDSTDYQWPCHCLLKEFQNLDRNIRLYLPDLHELPGESKAESIIEAISNSWKVVIVISEKSFTDEWFYFTIVSAVRLSSSRNAITSRIILLYLDDTPSTKMQVPRELLNVVTEDNTITGNDRFRDWNSIHQMIVSEYSPAALF